MSGLPRLLLVSDEVNVGGAELSFLKLAMALADLADVHLVIDLQSGHHPAISALRSSAAAHLTLHACTRRLYPGTLTNLHPFLRRHASSALAKLITQLRPGLILVNLPTLERGQSVLSAAARVSPKPPVWGLLHLVHPPSTLGAKFAHIRDLLAGTLIRRFDRILTVSQCGAQQLARDYGVASAEVVYPPTTPLQPVTSAAERARLRTELNLPRGTLVGLVGRVQLLQKGQDIGLRILARLLRRGLELHGVVIGDGPDLVALRRYVEDLGIAAEVSFLGWREDIESLLPVLDVLLMPSRFEGLPQTALQAATAHVPVVGYGVDGLGEFLPAGFQVSYGDETGLEAALRELVQGTRVWPAVELAQRAAGLASPNLVARTVLDLFTTSAHARSKAPLLENARGTQERFPGQNGIEQGS